MSLWERLFIVFVRFFAACRSYASPYFILTVPMDAMGYLPFVGERRERDIAWRICRPCKLYRAMWIPST